MTRQGRICLDKRRHNFFVETKQDLQNWRTIGGLILYALLIEQREELLHWSFQRGAATRKVHEENSDNDVVSITRIQFSH